MMSKDRVQENIDEYIASCEKIASLERYIASIKRQRDNEK